MFLGKFSQKRMSENLRCRWFEFYMEQFVCLGIDSGIQPIMLIVESDHGLVNRNVVLTPASFGL